MSLNASGQGIFLLAFYRVQSVRLTPKPAKAASKSGGSITTTEGPCPPLFKSGSLVLPDCVNEQVSFTLFAAVVWKIVQPARADSRSFD